MSGVKTEPACAVKEGDSLLMGTPVETPPIPVGPGSYQGYNPWKRGRHFKTGRHYGGKRGRHWKTGKHYVETMEALENRKALRSRAGRRFIITTDRFNFHPLYTMSRPFFLLVSVAVRHQTSLLCSPLQVPQILNRSQTPKDGSCHGKKKRKRKKEHSVLMTN